jgi:glycosyltransferase involved in cell wall biosynthesis
VKKKILLFGPIGDFGGRELETGFIANALSLEYNVDICSSATLTKKSQVHDFDKNQKVFSVNDLLCQRYFSIHFLSFLSYLKNGREITISSYANNKLSKKYFGYYKKVYSILGELILKYDLIFICAQLSSGLVSELIHLAKANKKKVLFRTTGAITNSEYDFVKDVDCFVHHSFKNARVLEQLKKHNFVVIDQCAFNENKLLEIPFSGYPINNFLILSRLSQEKGIEQIIEYFLRVCSENETLFVAGNGILEEELINKYKDLECVKFVGFVPNMNLSDLFRSIDCLIVPSPEESGPLVGIEAMAAGKIIISTKVGAMSERLNNTLNEFWFDYNDFDSFKDVFFQLKSLNENQINNVILSLRTRYKEEYSTKRITEKYLNVINEILK